MSAHDHLWFGIDQRLEEARKALDDAMRALRPPEHSRRAAALEAAGALVGGDWQSPFYSHVSTFLAKARSVPEIIESCFGADLGSSVMRTWFNQLPAGEQAHRDAFSAGFKAAKDAFKKLDLSNERNVSEHRLGFASIEGRIVGPFGKVHLTTPATRILIAESRDFGSDAPQGDAALLWAGTQSPQPIRPRWDQFTIGGKPLYQECSAYLDAARALRAQAGQLSDSIHGNQPLTSPPT